MNFFGQIGGMFDDAWNFLTGGHLYGNGNLTSAETASLSLTGSASNANTGTTGNGSGIAGAIGITPLEEFGVFAVVILILAVIGLYYWKK